MVNRFYGKIKLGLEVIRNIKNWPLIFLNYFKIIHLKYLSFKFKDGKRITLKNIEDKMDTSGIAMIWEIFIRKNYNPKGFEINKGEIVIDIGANIGLFSIYASMNALNGKIYSYEPFTPHYKRFVENIRLNKISNIIPFNLGVCGEKGKKNLFINDKSSGMHSMVFSKDSKEKVSVDCTTLNEIFKKNKIKICDFLKIDCEGVEYEILYSAPKNILNKIKKISLEFDNIDKEKRNCFELKRFLEKNNFEVRIRGERESQGILYAFKKN